MPVSLTNPDRLPSPDLYHQVSVATGSRLVHIAGQIARDADSNLVADGDLAGQVEQCLRNVNEALAAVTATFADVTQLRVYIVRWTPDMTPALAEGYQRVWDELQISPAPITVVGVWSLDDDHHLVEIEATAVVD